MIFSAGKARNDVGIYCHKRKVRKQMVSFYYISKDKKDMPVRPTDPKEWSKYVDNNCIIHSTQKRAYEPLQCIQVVTPVPPDNGETISPSPAELHDKACKKSGSFWKDLKNEKLFNSLDVEGLLNEWINQLKVAKFDMSTLNEIVNKSDKSLLEEMHHIPLLQIKVMYLQQAYEFVLHDLPPNGTSWEACCEQSIKFLQSFVDKIHYF